MPEDNKEIAVSTNLTNFTKNALAKYYTDAELAELDREIPKEVANKIHQSMINLTTGAYSSIPRICLGRRCPSQHACPFMQSSLESRILGKKCPVEIMLVESWKEEYDQLIRENNQDPDQIVIRNYVYQLIECDVVAMRLNHYLGNTPEHGGGEITESPFVVNPKTGSLEYQKTENIALSIKVFVNSRREQAIKALIASPFWKKKMADKTGTDDLNANIDLFARAKAAGVNTQERDADFTVVDDDIAN